MMNTGGEGVTEFINAEIEAKNDAHFSVSPEANADNVEHGYREVKRIKTDSRMAESLSEQQEEERGHISITSLPQEIIAMIFSHLDAHFLCTTVTQVCQYFHNVLKSEGFWKSRKTLYFDEDESGIDFIMTVIPKCPNIRHLNVNFCRKGPETSIIVPNISFPCLHSLVMNNVKPRAENAFKMIVQGAPYLKVISLDCVVSKMTNRVIAEVKELNTFSLFCMNDNFMEYEPILTNIFKSCAKLEIVLLGNIDVDPLLTLSEVCSGARKSLSWSGEFSDIAIERLSFCLEVLHLNLCSKGVTNEGAKFIRNMKRMESLHIDLFLNNSFNLSSGGYIEMFEYNAFPLLKNLSFNRCDDIDDTVLKAVANNLRGLEFLEIRDTNVTDLGIRFMLTFCRNLRCLRFSPYDDGDGVSFSYVKDLPICCPRLHFLGLLDKPVPEPIIQEFMNTHPSYNFKICEELTDLNFHALCTENLSDLSSKPIIAYVGDDDVEHVKGHK